MQKVVKFGGSSLANSTQFEKVKNIVTSDISRRIVVVSALGKRNKDDYKITDLLFLTQAHLKYGVDEKSVFQIVKDRYFEVAKDLNLSLDLDLEFKNIEKEFSKTIDKEMLVSRGEYLAAKMMAEYLGYQFIDAKDVIFFDYSGVIDSEKTDKAVQDVLKKYDRIVVPGFYGAYPDGKIHLLSRGGSDVTGSILAKAADATIYENWTDVSGFLVTDPRIVPDPKQIKEISYEELRELSYMGANVDFPVTLSSYNFRTKQDIENYLSYIDSAPEAFASYIDYEYERTEAGYGFMNSVIREIVEKTHTKIDISDDGVVKIASMKKEEGDAALEWIMGIVAEPEEGKIYHGTITKIMDFGAFVRFLGTTEGLVHISEVKNERIASVSDFYKEGDQIWVKCLGADNRGKIKLSAKRVNQETGEDLEN